MSRIGKLPIKLADKVKATVERAEVNFEGPKGKLSGRCRAASVDVKDGRSTSTAGRRPSRGPRLHGLASAPGQRGQGRGHGWERNLDIRGVGFRAEVKGKQIHFSLGYSHPIVFDLPEGVTAEVARHRGQPAHLITLRARTRRRWERPR